jgi:hypothetical protein
MVDKIPKHSQKSPRVEKQDEMPDYETTNGVTPVNRIQTTVSNCLTHSDSYNKIPQQRLYTREEIEKILEKIYNIDGYESIYDYKRALRVAFGVEK